MRAVLSLFVLICIAAVSIAAPFTATSMGVVGGNALFADTVAYTTPVGLKGPVTVSVDTVLTSDIDICINAGANAIGADLSEVCDQGMYTSLSNSTAADLKFTRKTFSAFSSTKRSARFSGSQRFVLDDDTTDSSVLNLAPGTDYYITAVSSSSTQDLITIKLEGDVCDNGMGESCIVPNADPFAGGDQFVNRTVNAGSYYYFEATVAMNVGGIHYSAMQADDSDEENVVSIFVAPYYLPTKDNHAQVYENDDDDITTVSIADPYGPTWYIGIYNSGNENHVVTLNMTADVCSDNHFGIGCAYMPANITSLNAANTTQVLKASGDDDDLVFFQVTNTHCCGTPADATHVRVSATPTGSGKAPTLFARQGAPPSISYHDFNSSDSYVNQLVLPILPVANADNAFVSYAWYVGALGDQSFYIWSGGNCANNCSNNKHGNCTCNGAECNLATLYTLPTTTNDSFGQCQCDSKSYTNYDCTGEASSSSSSSTFQTIYIVLIAVGGAIVLAVAIGVPVYCYLQNRKKHNYERV